MSPSLPTKALGIASLTHVDLGNHNAGEGGSQLSNLKTVDNRPYISGQAYRHAIKDALRNLTAEGVDCTPRYACGEIESCKLCDLFGYMNTDLDGDDDPNPKRVSPLRVSPLVGQYDRPVTTDMILQYDVENADNRIGYRELSENVFHGALAVDVPAIGQRENESIADGDDGVRFSRELNDELESNERVDRLAELLRAVQNTSQLAGQARHMADFMPDLMVAAALPVYNQRIMNAITVDAETGELNVALLENVLTDLTRMDGQVWIAGTHHPGVITNWEAVMDTAQTIDGVEMVDTVSGCFDTVIDHFETAL